AGVAAPKRRAASKHHSAGVRDTTIAHTFTPSVTHHVAILGTMRVSRKPAAVQRLRNSTSEPWVASARARPDATQSTSHAHRCQDAHIDPSTPAVHSYSRCPPFEGYED